MLGNEHWMTSHRCLFADWPPYWSAGLRLVDPAPRREQWCDEKKQKRKRDRGDWIDHLVVKESNAAYGDD